VTPRKEPGRFRSKKQYKIGLGIAKTDFCNLDLLCGEIIYLFDSSLQTKMLPLNRTYACDKGLRGLLHQVYDKMQ
jgi:hypothetical protein